MSYNPLRLSNTLIGKLLKYDEIDGLDTIVGIDMQYSGGQTGIGNVYPNEVLTISGVISFLEQASSPSNNSGYGKLFCKTDSNLYFRNDAGAETNLSNGGNYKYQIYADMMDSPAGSDWFISSPAALAADSNNSALTIRQFDDSTEEAIGFMLEVPSGMTQLNLGIKSRAETLQLVSATVDLALYQREIRDNQTVVGWEKHQISTIDIPTNLNWQHDTETLSLSTLGVTAGSLYQWELTRDVISGTDTCSGDWNLLGLTLEFE